MPYLASFFSLFTRLKIIYWRKLKPTLVDCLIFLERCNPYFSSLFWFDSHSPRKKKRPNPFCMRFILLNLETRSENRGIMRDEDGCEEWENKCRSQWIFALESLRESWKVTCSRIEEYYHLFFGNSCLLNQKDEEFPSYSFILRIMKKTNATTYYLDTCMGRVCLSYLVVGGSSVFHFICIFFLRTNLFVRTWKNQLKTKAWKTNKYRIS